MKTIEQYHFNRDYFTSVFDEIFANRCFDLEVACRVRQGNVGKKNGRGGQTVYDLRLGG